MAFNGSGTYSRSFSWTTDKGNAVPVTASRMDSEMDGMATGLSTAICKDGQTVTTARIPLVLGASAMQGAVGGVSYAFTNDLDTGIYSPATDQTAIAAGGVQVIKWTSAGGTIPGGIVLQGDAIQKADGTPYDGFASGTEIVFHQTSAPTGWVKQTTHNDKALRIVSGTVSSGGVSPFTTVLGLRTTDSHALTTAEMPSHVHVNTLTDPGHSHTVQGNQNAAGSTFVTKTSTLSGNISVDSNTTGITINNASAGSDGGHTHTYDMRVQYVDCIIAVKS